MEGLGVSKAHEGFSSLEGVPRELHAIFREAGKDNETGILPGMVRLDDGFTEKAMVEGLRGGYPVVHIASHFSYNAARSEMSFLLLGDGGHLTLGEMKEMAGLFENVDLLTLSACDTATSPLTANGKDVEGLAYLAQNLGAKAVVASLWPVADVGTEVLMRRFYEIRKANPLTTKSEAFNRAQLALLGGEEVRKESHQDSSGEQAKPNRGPQVKDTVKLASYKADPKRPFAHPHYWAAFILIGNFK